MLRGADTSTDPNRGPGPLPHSFPPNISVYFHVKQEGKADIAKMFTSVPAVPGILIQRGEALSITVAGLILLMRQYRHRNRIGNQTIEDLITGESIALVDLGTTRVPDFGSLAISSASAAAVGAYRELEALGDAETRIAGGDTFPTAELSLSTEIIVSAATSNPAATEFFVVWHPLLVRPSSLFIIIATIHLNISFQSAAGNVWLTPPTSEESPHSLQDGALSHLSSWSASDFSEAISPSQSHDSLYQAVFRSPGSDLPSFTSQPSLTDVFDAIPAAQTHSGGGKSKKSRARAPKQARLRSSSASKNNQLVERMMQGDVNSVTFKQAQFVDKSPLAEMVRQYQAMSHCLGLLGLIGTKAEMSNSKRVDTITTADGASPPIFLSAEAVLVACNWVPQTFVNKTGIYPPAKAATQLAWKGRVPVETDIDNTAELYRTWRGAQYLWSAAGPVCAGGEADDKSSLNVEVWAAKLSQTTLNKIKTQEFAANHLVALDT
ncbi:hypothetical protein B0H12DRAFT_162038 [Mycena haematopus]|nr:hypothetical protein B0H12DRAFT_162038 [Mycena haematopus]